MFWLILIPDLRTLFISLTCSNFFAGFNPPPGGPGGQGGDVTAQDQEKVITCFVATVACMYHSNH